MKSGIEVNYFRCWHNPNLSWGTSPCCSQKGGVTYFIGVLQNNLAQIFLKSEE